MKKLILAAVLALSPVLAFAQPIPGAAISIFSAGAGCVASTAVVAGTCVQRDSTGGIAVGGVNVTDSTVPANGMYINAANQIALSTNSSGRFFLSSSGSSLNISPANSNSAILLSGTLNTSGTSTTNLPQIFVQPSGTTAATSWSTSGTGLGMNLASGFAGNFLDFHVAGGASVFSVTSAGRVNTTLLASSGSVIASGNSGLQLSGRSIILSSSDGALQFRNNANDADSTIAAGAATFSGIVTVPGAANAMITSSSTFTSGAGANTGTLTNSPVSGNPTSWIKINDNGVTRYIPAW